MSSIDQATDPSISNFVSIFDAASNEYRKVTKHDLHTHPFAARLYNCDSPEAVLNVFRMQTEAFDEFLKGDDRLMKWLDPTVNILFTLSATLGEGIGLVSVLIYLFSITRPQRGYFSHLHLQKQYLQVSVFFSEYVSS
jgi:hypothetical protein